MATSILHIPVEESLEARATVALDAIGLSMSAAVSALLTRIVSEQRFPFDLSSLDELDRVRTKVELRAEEGLLPIGSEGTIVHRYLNGQAFEVEFAKPVQALVTLRPEEIVRIDD